MKKNRDHTDHTRNREFVFLIWITRWQKPNLRLYLFLVPKEPDVFFRICDPGKKNTNSLIRTSSLITDL